MRQEFIMAAEGTSVRGIMSQLAGSGVTHRNGKPLTVPTLWRHLTDPAYAGLGKSKRTFWLSGPVVSERLFHAVQTALKTRLQQRQKRQLNRVPHNAER